MAEPGSGTETERPVERGGLGRVRDTLGIPHYAPFFASNFMQFLCGQVAMMAMQWLITDLTESRLLITMVAFVQGGTIFVLSPLGGVVADRVAKRRLLVFGRVSMFAIVWTLAWLVMSDRILILHIMATSLIGGVLISALQPATQTFVFDLVGRERLENAVALNATGSGVAQVLGPAAGGVLLAGIGIAGTLAVAGGGILMAAGLLLAIPLAGKLTRAERQHPLRELREGFRWVWGDRGVRLVMLASTTAFFNGAVFSLRPVFARFVLDVGELGLGAMAASQGVGTVLGALWLASLASFHRVGVWIIGSSFAFSLVVVLYAFSFSLPYILVIEFLMGVTGQVWMVTTMAGLQLAVPDEMRGRIIGMVFMVAQLGFLGQPLVGALADRVGDQIALGVYGAVPSVILGLVLLLRLRVLMSVGERSRA